MPEALPCVCAVDLGGLMVHAGHILQARQENHDQVAGEPHGDQCQRRNDLRGRADEHQAFDAELGEDVVEQAPLRVVQPAPADVDGGCGQHIGQVEDRAEEAAGGDLAVEQHCDDQRIDHAADDSKQGEIDGDFDGFLEVRIRGEELDIVIDAVPFRCAGSAPLEKAQAEHRDQRNIGQHDQADKCGDEVEIRSARFLAEQLALGFLSAFGQLAHPFFELGVEKDILAGRRSGRPAKTGVSDISQRVLLTRP